MGELQIIDQREIFGKQFKMYGDLDNPIFLAKDVAEWIDYAKTGNGAYNVSAMLATVDEGEKLVSKILISGQMREMWFLNEDGLYEVLMQSRKPIAKKFKKKVKEILRILRKTGTYSVNPAPKEDAQLARAKAMLLNAKTRAANTWLKIAATVNIPEYKQIASTYAANTLADKEILSLPKTAAKTYTATEIGNIFGVSSQKVGKIANANGLKASEYGIEVWDKSPYSAKQIPAWRYYEAALPVFRRLLSQEVSLEVVKGGAAQ